jgi:hypothetical protein
MPKWLSCSNFRQAPVGKGTSRAEHEDRCMRGIPAVWLIVGDWSAQNICRMHHEPLLTH